MARRKSLKLSTPLDVRKALARVANMLINEEIDPKIANAIVYTCNAILAALRTDEYERRLDELEYMIEKMNI